MRYLPLIELNKSGLRCTDHLVVLEEARKNYGPIKTFFRNVTIPVGIEVEVENALHNIYKRYKDLYRLYWEDKQDGSLKDEGLEFISCPLIRENIDYAIKELSLFIGEGEAKWSHRTSIHVHANVSNFTLKQLVLLVSVYALLEDLYFSRVSPIRKHNPYCYPLLTTNPADLSFNNHLKYCAFNVESVKKYSTVEFRHHEGMEDWRNLRRWIQLITKLIFYIESNKTKRINDRLDELIVTRQFVPFVQEIWGVHSGLFTPTQIQESGEAGILWSTIFREHNNVWNF